VEAANRKGISGQGKLGLRPGEPVASKGARRVREEGFEKGHATDTTCKAWQASRDTKWHLAGSLLHEEMTAPITLPHVDEQTLTKLRNGYEEPFDAETRTRYQMLLRAPRHAVMVSPLEGERT
jgi:hypothetical protein